MKRLIPVLVLLTLASALGAEEISVSLAGKPRDGVSAYKVGEAYFLDAKQAGELYGGQVYWYPVSGRLQISFRGRAIQFLIDSQTANLDGKPFKMDAAVMLRTSQAYIPLSFFQSEEFSAFAGMESAFNPKTEFLSVDRRSSVGSVRWFSYKDATRLILPLDKRTSFVTAARGVGGVEVAFPYGTIAAAEQAEIGDGIVDQYSLHQQANSAKLSIKFADSDVHWRARELSDPRRLVVDLYRGQAPSIPAEPSLPAAVPAAAPVPASSAPVAALPKEAKTKRRIVIDAGHGGKDPGATGRGGTLEKDINLLAALELAKLLKSEGTFDVMLTRNDDTFVPLAERSRKANDFGADLFISLHCNASTSPSENGFEVYFLSEKASDPAAQKLADYENSVVELEGNAASDQQADMILGELSKTENINASSEWAALLAKDLDRRVDIADHGVKQAGFYVLRGTHAPAVLFEMAYISNKKDEAKLHSKAVRGRIVDGVYAGILDYAKREGWKETPN